MHEETSIGLIFIIFVLFIAIVFCMQFNYDVPNVITRKVRFSNDASKRIYDERGKVLSEKKIAV